MSKKRRVYIGSSTETLPIAEALQANLADPTLADPAEARIWNQDLHQEGNSVLEDLLKFTEDFDYAVFIWAGEDGVVSRGQAYSSPRDNVIFEAGLFYSALKRERVVLLLEKLTDGDSLKIPSDLIGINQIKFSRPSDNNWRGELGPASTKIRERLRILPDRHSNSPPPAQSAIQEKTGGRDGGQLAQSNYSSADSMPTSREKLTILSMKDDGEPYGYVLTCDEILNLPSRDENLTREDVTAALEQLEARGLVERISSERKIYVITVKGWNWIGQHRKWNS